MTWKRAMMILMMTINQRELVRKAAEGEKGQPETEVAVLINLAFPSTKCLFFHFLIIYLYVLHNPEMQLIYFSNLPRLSPTILFSLAYRDLTSQRTWGGEKNNNVKVNNNQGQRYEAQKTFSIFQILLIALIFKEQNVALK